MSDHDKLTDEQLATLTGYGWTTRLEKRLIPELIALRALRDEVEPVLRFHEKCDVHSHCEQCAKVIADILARHYDKKEPKK